MNDQTVPIRKVLTSLINGTAAEMQEDDLRASLVDTYGADNVFNTDELREKFDVIGFAAPMVVAVRKDTGEKGSLFFSHNPRFYFDWRVK